MPNTGEDISSLIHLNHFTLIALRMFLLQELAHSLRRFKQSATQSTAEKKLCNQQTITCETADSFIWIWDMTQESTTSPCHLTRVLQDKPNLSRRIFFTIAFFFFLQTRKLQHYLVLVSPAPCHKSASVRARFNLVLSRRGSDTAAGVSGIQRRTARAGRRHDAPLRQ